MSTSTIFWGLFALDTIALVVLAILSSRGPSSPEGPVGAWIAIIPPILMAILAGVVLVVRTDSMRMAGIWILGFPWAMVVIGPAYEAFQKYQTERSIAGDDDFSGDARKLAHAITARDVAQVKALTPLVGDLNRIHGTQTILNFAIENARDPAHPQEKPPAAGVEIVQILLEAGARANTPARYDSLPLTGAMYSGPELTGVLLKAGADPNHIDSSGRPLWWNVLSGDTDREYRTLQVLLDHGANLQSRDREGGPVAWAAYYASSAYNSSWRKVLLLIERGAPWKDEQEFGQPVRTMLERDFEGRTLGKRPISEEMQRIQELYNAGSE